MKKLLSVAVPCYNSQAYMRHCIDTLLTGGDEMEILVVNDGSSDDTRSIADEYAAAHPGVVKAVHKENGGHGDAVMAGLNNATGLYFKVVDSDDWVDEEALRKVIEVLRKHAARPDQIDLMVCNYVYDKQGATHKHVVRYGNALPQNRVFGWEETRKFAVGQYITMHTAIYRRELLLECGLSLPKKTFYVDNIYIYHPMTLVNRMYYLDLDLYHYFIGRDDQSVNEQVMIRRIDQQLRVNRLMMELVDLTKVEPRRKRHCMSNYLEIITTISSIMLVIMDTKESLEMKSQLWQEMRDRHPAIYRMLRWRLLGIMMHLPGKLGRKLMVFGYHVSNKIFGFN